MPRVRARPTPGCRAAFIWPPAIDPLAPKNMALSPEDAAYIVDQFGIDVQRPLLTQVSRFDPWKDPLGVIDAYRAREGGDPGRAARARRLDGARRPRGLGLLQPDGRLRGRRSGHLHPLEPQQRRLRRGQRVPGALRGRAPEVDPRGLRPDRQRGALEGAADRRGPRRRDRRRRSTTARRAGSSTVGGGCAAACSRSCDDPVRRAARALARQGVRPHALPDAAPAARLARALQPAARRRRGRRGSRQAVGGDEAAAEPD